MSPIDVVALALALCPLAFVWAWLGHRMHAAACRRAAKRRPPQPAIERVDTLDDSGSDWRA